MGLLERKIRIQIFLFLVLANLGCNKWVATDDPSINAVTVYENMWKTMDGNYALFPLKGIDWDSVYSTERSKISENTSNTELFSVISETLETLRDGHITIMSGNDTSTYDGFYKGYPVNFNFDNVKKYYLYNEYSTSGPLIYKIRDSVGYLYYASFRETLSDVDLEQVMNDFISTKGLIIDVRNNSGGDLVNVEKLFSRFINTRKLVKFEVKKKGPGHSEYADKEPIYISPAGAYYEHPVVILTNRKCFSACNDFVMFMSFLPGVTLVGDRTGGGGAIPADFLLLNGWTLQYSASMTLSPDGVAIESGIPPDYQVDINSIDDAEGRDPILEKGYELLH